jgi:hypothetical protein
MAVRRSPSTKSRAKAPTRRKASVKVKDLPVAKTGKVAGGALQLTPTVPVVSPTIPVLPGTTQGLL